MHSQRETWKGVGQGPGRARGSGGGGWQEGERERKSVSLGWHFSNLCQAQTSHPPQTGPLSTPGPRGILGGAAPVPTPLRAPRELGRGRVTDAGARMWLNSGRSEPQPLMCLKPHKVPEVSEGPSGPRSGEFGSGSPVGISRDAQGLFQEAQGVCAQEVGCLEPSPSQRHCWGALGL